MTFEEFWVHPLVTAGRSNPNSFYWTTDNGDWIEKPDVRALFEIFQAVSASIADTAKPVAWQETDVYWNPLDAFSTREDAFAYQRPLYAATPAPSVADVFVVAVPTETGWETAVVSSPKDQS